MIGRPTLKKILKHFQRMCYFSQKVKGVVVLGNQTYIFSLKKNGEWENLKEQNKEKKVPAPPPPENKYVRGNRVLYQNEYMSTSK